MKESHEDLKRLGEHPEMQRLGGHPEAQRLNRHPAPEELPAHEEAAPAAAPLMDDVATADIQETKGIFRGAGWVALAILAIMVAAALIWRPKIDGNTRLTALSNSDIPTYRVAEIDGVAPLDTIVEMVSTVGYGQSKATAGKGYTSSSKRHETATSTPTAVVVFLFNTDNSQVPETASLTAIAGKAAKSGKTVVVKAYTDETGNADYNRRLSNRRAKAVGDYMVAHGVPAHHVKAKGYGPTHAYANNAQDRRAEVTLE